MVQNAVLVDQGYQQQRESQVTASLRSLYNGLIKVTESGQTSTHGTEHRIKTEVVK